jgi:protein-S-isoprenylcysteine O-methyltransferase Ste14
MDRVRVRAWVGTVVFLVLTPGVVAGLIPGLITRWRIPWAGGWASPPAIVGGVLVLCGVLVLLDAFARFARADGTPAPPAPTAHLVVVGPYRFVRNPMYLAVLSIICGQALLFGSWGTLVYAGVVLLAVASFVRLYEEPTLEAEYGEEYRAYRRRVRGWLPRVRPWRGANGVESPGGRRPPGLSDVSARGSWPAGGRSAPPPSSGEGGPPGSG